MILHINYLPQERRAAAGDLMATLFGLLEEGRVDPNLLSHLRVHLDWIQYKANFREPVTVRRATDGQGGPLPLAELAVDLRQAEPARLRDDLARALAAINAGESEPGDRVVLDDFTPLSQSGAV